MTNTKQEPKAFCELHHHKPRGEKPYFTWVVSQCPLCKNRHIHGAGDDESKVKEFLGHRAADCSGRNGLPAPTGYYLVEKASTKRKEGEQMEAVERVKEFDEKDRGLIAVRLNEPCFKLTDCHYRKGDILLIKPFGEGDTVTLRQGHIYLSLANGKHLFLERFNEDPAEWREPEPGFFYSTIFAGYFQVTPSDEVDVIGEVLGIKDDRKVQVVQSGFVKGNPHKRLNYRFEGNHTNKDYNRFIDVCQGRATFEKSKDAIKTQTETEKGA